MSIELWRRFRYLVGQTLTPGIGKSVRRYRQLEFEFCSHDEGLMKEKRRLKSPRLKQDVTISSNVRKPLDK